MIYSFTLFGFDLVFSKNQSFCNPSGHLNMLLCNNKLTRFQTKILCSSTWFGQILPHTNLSWRYKVLNLKIGRVCKKNSDGRIFTIFNIFLERPISSKNLEFQLATMSGTFLRSNKRIWGPYFRPLYLKSESFENIETPVINPSYDAV